MLVAFGRADVQEQTYRQRTGGTRLDDALSLRRFIAGFASVSVLIVADTLD